MQRHSISTKYYTNAEGLRMSGNNKLKTKGVLRGRCAWW